MRFTVDDMLVFVVPLLQESVYLDGLVIAGVTVEPPFVLTAGLATAGVPDMVHVTPVSEPEIFHESVEGLPGCTRLEVKETMVGREFITH